MADERSCFLDTNSKTPFAPRLLRLFNQFSVGKVLPLLSSLLARAMANFNLVLFGRWDIVFVPVCVCVCPPLDGFFPLPCSTTFYKQGAEGSPVVASANEAPHWTIRKTYLRRDTTPLFLAVF